MIKGIPIIPIRVLTPGSIESDFYRGKQHNASSTQEWFKSILDLVYYVELEGTHEDKKKETNTRSI